MQSWGPVLTYAVVTRHFGRSGSLGASVGCEPRSAAPAVQKFGARVHPSTVWAQTGTILRSSKYLGGRVGEMRRCGDLFARIERKGSPITLVLGHQSLFPQMAHTISLDFFSRSLCGDEQEERARSEIDEIRGLRARRCCATGR